MVEANLKKGLENVLVIHGESSSVIACRSMMQTVGKKRQDERESQRIRENNSLSHKASTNHHMSNASCFRAWYAMYEPGEWCLSFSKRASTSSAFSSSSKTPIDFSSYTFVDLIDTAIGYTACWENATLFSYTGPWK